MQGIDGNTIKKIHNQNISDPVNERLLIAGLICSLAKDFSNELVVVGGSAVEFYTAASYMTKDIDFIAKDDFQISKIMTSLGFTIDDGYTWFHPDTSVVVEFPKPPLAGDINRLTEVETEYGTAKIIGIEDIILDRLKGREFWQDNNELPEMMILSHYDDIDFEYLRSQAEYELVGDVLEKAISDVECYKEGKSPYLRNRFYSDKIIEQKIIDALEYDVPLDKIVSRLATDDQVKGSDSVERKAYIKYIVSASAEIQKLLKE
ncbi:MAG: hypothetical protein Q4E64_06670 [Phascolarctobacterium sp.]|uniref:DUF6036 family nucleotidyltransferase n=1 Tax=Phascolarctobacterium sp. TaxID=2049039 RepID=UPI0026DCA27C|nr:DUF6036 family nucleotidyltransferase [Phascolarctobacterium sp.]MDO4921491.1 hypothetical protein [Phascolarctobacterium sp.]